MGIYKASGTANGIYVGATSANKAYKGDTEIWNSIPEPQLPDWFPYPDSYKSALETAIARAIAAGAVNYTVTIGMGWTREPVHTEATMNYADSAVIWASDNSLNFTLRTNGNYQYNYVPNSGAGIKYVYINGGGSGSNAWSASSNVTSVSSYDDIRKNGIGNSKILSAIFRYKNSPGVIVTNTVPLESGYEYYDLT